MKQEISVCLPGIALIDDAVSRKVHVKTNYDHSANCSSYKTYFWLKGQSGDSLWNERIKQKLASQLAAKGWTKVDSGCVHYRGKAEGLTTERKGAAEVLSAGEPEKAVQ